MRNGLCSAFVDELISIVIGREFHRDHKEHRAYIRENEPNLRTRRKSLLLNYGWDAFRKAFRYAPYALAAYGVHEFLNDNPSHYPPLVGATMLQLDLTILGHINPRVVKKIYPTDIPLEERRIARDLEEFNERNDKIAQEAGFATYEEMLDHENANAITFEGDSVDPHTRALLMAAEERIAREYGVENKKIHSGNDLEPYYIKLRAALDTFKEDIFGR